MKRFMDDILLIIGVIIVIASTFFINVLAGFYLTGFVLIGMAVLVPSQSKKTPDQARKED
jgi:hypothetical protein